MAIRERLGRFTTPQGPIPRFKTVDISSEDFVDDGGFIFHCVQAGTVVYRGLDNEDDTTATFADAGGFDHVCGLPVVARAVRTTGSTVTSIRVGYP